MSEQATEDFVVGDIVRASWQTAKGKWRHVEGQVRQVTKTKLRVEYQRMSVSGRAMNWSVVETTVPKEHARKTGHSKEQVSQVAIRAALGLPRRSDGARDE